MQAKSLSFTKQDIREVFKETALLLYMRSEEAASGYLHGIGMAAVEAACAGVPTLAHPGPGLKESLADGGNWLDSYRPADWAEAIDNLMQPDSYRDAVARTALVVDRLDPVGDILRLESALKKLVGPTSDRALRQQFALP